MLPILICQDSPQFLFYPFEIKKLLIFFNGTLHTQIK